MASSHPKFPQVLSKLLSRTFDYSNLDGNLEILHPSLFSGKKPNPSIFWQTYTTCVRSAFQTAWGQGQGRAATGTSCPTATRLVEIGLLEKEVGAQPPLTTQIITLTSFSNSSLYRRVLESQFKSHFKLFFTYRKKKYKTLVFVEWKYYAVTGFVTASYQNAQKVDQK